MAEEGPVAPEIIQKLQAAAGGKTEISPGARVRSRPALHWRIALGLEPQAPNARDLNRT